MAVLCVAGQTYTLEFSLEDQGNAGLWKANPTIAVADFQISVNGGAFSNVDNIPTVTPAAGRRVALVISAAETTAAGAGGLLYIQGVDAAGDEWYDVGFSVRVHAATGDVALTGDEMHLDATQGAVEFGQVKITANVAGEGALDITNSNATGIGQRNRGVNYGMSNQATGGNSTGMACSGLGSGMTANGIANYGLSFSGGTGAVDPMWAEPGADGDTLETLSDQIDLQATAAAVVVVDANVDTILAAIDTAEFSVISVIDGDVLTIRTADTWDTYDDITGLGDIASREILYFCVKNAKADADADSIVLIEETAGLMVLNATDATARAANGSITVTDEDAGDLTIVLDEAETDDLTPNNGLYWALKMITATDATTIAEGQCKVVRGTVRAIA